jgi:dihydroorotate dehydrogenase
MDCFSLIKPLLYLTDPELAHNLAIWALKHGLVPKAKAQDYENLRLQLWGGDFTSPLGLAAGFDKNAEVIPAILRQGFAFTEVGTITPRAQAGNPKKRLFRLLHDQAIINRMGFNNLGSDYALEQLKTQQGAGIIGVNIGKNKDTVQALEDYCLLVEKFYLHSSYIVVNISSPNTPGLRDLQQGDDFELLLTQLLKVRNHMFESSKHFVPLIVKIAPDLTTGQLEFIANLALQYKLDGLTISNTTIARSNLRSKDAGELGGLSGKPLLESSNMALKEVYRLTKGELPLIGVGGISSGDDAYLKICLGASLLQIYSVLIYEGFGVVHKIKQRLSQLLEQNGFNNVKDAVGSQVEL